MKKRYLAGLMAGLILIAAAGCGSSSKNTTSEMAAEAMDTYAYASEESVAEAPAEGAEWEYDNDSGAVTSENGIESVAETARKLIKTVNLEMQTKEFDAVVESISKKVQEMGGYIEDSSVWGSSYYSTGARSASYTLRIPSDRLDEFVEATDELGNITYKNESVEDVTLRYVDVESRKKALETEQARLLELLEQADNLEDLLTIESRLSDVRYELENYGSQLRLLDNQVDYSTVYLNINEVERIIETKERTFFEEIADRFNDSLYIVGRGLRGFAIGFLGSLPILAVWAVVIAALAFVLRKVFYGKKKDRKIRKKEEPPQDNPPMGPEV